MNDLIFLPGSRFSRRFRGGHKLSCSSCSDKNRKKLAQLGVSERQEEIPKDKNSEVSNWARVRFASYFFEASEIALMCKYRDILGTFVSLLYN